MPGGKREPSDASLWDAAAREFFEETGSVIPTGNVDYRYVEYADDHHACRFYYANVADATADALLVGQSPDPMGKEASVSWRAPVVSLLRPHLRQGLALVKIMLPRDHNGNGGPARGGRASKGGNADKGGRKGGGKPRNSHRHRGGRSREGGGEKRVPDENPQPVGTQEVAVPSAVAPPNELGARIVEAGMAGLLLSENAAGDGTLDANE